MAAAVVVVFLCRQGLLVLCLVAEGGLLVEAGQIPEGVGILDREGHLASFAEEMVDQGEPSLVVGLDKSLLEPVVVEDKILAGQDNRLEYLQK